MEVRAYLHVLLKKWWIVIPTFLVTLTAGIVFTYLQTPVFSATTTYVVVPSPSFNDVQSLASGLDILGRRAEIATTYAEIASSRRLKQLAADSLSLQLGPDYSITSRLLAGTNIIEITVDGPDPVVVRDLANAIGTTMEAYVQGLYEAFILVLLDEAVIPESPTTPNKALNFALAAVLGLVLGGVLAFLADYLTTPYGWAESKGDTVDDEAGAHDNEYFLRSLSREMLRARRERSPLSLGLLRLETLSSGSGTDSSRIQAEMLSWAAVLAGHYLRKRDTVACLDDGVLALILPDTTGEDATVLIERLQTRIARTPFQSSASGVTANLRSVVGITAYGHNGTSRDELVATANRALQLAEVEADGRVYLMTDSLNGDEHVE